MANPTIAATTLESLLDQNLDDLADAPEFKPFPAGAHRVILEALEQKKIGTHPAVVIKLKAVETLELASTEDTPLEAGATTDISYMMDNEYGQGDFKKVAAALKGIFPACRTVGDILREAKGAEVMVVTSVRQNKDKTQSYTTIVELAA